MCVGRRHYCLLKAPLGFQCMARWSHHLFSGQQSGKKLRFTRPTRTNLSLTHPFTGTKFALLHTQPPPPPVTHEVGLQEDSVSVGKAVAGDCSVTPGHHHSPGCEWSQNLPSKGLSWCQAPGCPGCGTQESLQAFIASPGVSGSILILHAFSYS